ncbi:hypothetical protein B484DRAFT_407624, partial [Ochromonadaceae sp. CCMP2298]
MGVVGDAGMLGGATVLLTECLLGLDRGEEAVELEASLPHITALVDVTHVYAKALSSQSQGTQAGSSQGTNSQGTQDAQYVLLLERIGKTCQLVEDVMHMGGGGGQGVEGYDEWLLCNIGMCVDYAERAVDAQVLLAHLKIITSILMAQSSAPQAPVQELTAVDRFLSLTQAPT